MAQAPKLYVHPDRYDEVISLLRLGQPIETPKCLQQTMMDIEVVKLPFIPLSDDEGHEVLGWWITPEAITFPSRRGLV